MRDAIDAARTLTFPCVLLRASDFASLGHLKPYEAVRHLHTYIDSMEELSGGSDIKVIFFSHQWTSFEHPDHTGPRYDCNRYYRFEHPYRLQCQVTASVPDHVTGM